MTYDLTLQKRIAAQIMKVGTTRVRFGPAKLNDIKAAITKHDVRALIAQGVVSAIPEQGVSRSRARKIATQRSKGLRKGPGKREGKATARTPAKRVWINKVRAQRAFLKELKESGVLSAESFMHIYRKSKGGFFRSVRHIKIYMNEQSMATRPAKK